MTITPNTPVTLKVPAVKYWDESLSREVTIDAEITCEFPHTGLYWLWDGFSQDDHKQVTVYSEDYKTPDWIKGGVCYHVFVDRFADGKREMSNSGYVPEWTDDKIGLDRCGGNLEGVRANLEYLAELGVNCVYLSPVFTANSAHKYNASNYETIDAEFGDLETFKSLCSDAKALGIRVILDGVFSHCGINSEYTRRHPDWFVYEDDGKTPKYWWGINTLPVFDKTNAKYIEHVTGAGGIAKRWLEAGASGWRLDVVDELPDAFLDPLCKRVKAHDPDALIIGEVWEDASNKIAYGVRRRYFLGGQLDGTMKYPLRDAIIGYVTGGKAESIAKHMSDFLETTPKPAVDCMMNVLGTHDTVRILTALGAGSPAKSRREFSKFRMTADEYELGKKRLKLASALQYTLPGFPCVYYGDEAGLQGGADPFNRMPYPWGREDAELVEWYRYLGKIRRDYGSALSGGSYQLIKASDGEFTFIRGGQLIVSVDNLELTVEIINN